jgi:hypothetical protein
MPFVPVPNVALIEAVYTQDAQVMENTMYFQHTGTPTLADLQALADAVNVAIRGSLLPLLSTTIQLLRVVGTLLDVAEGLQVFSTDSLPAAGADNSAPIPSDVSFAISFKTAQRGRSFRGRNYMLGLHRDALGTSINTITTAFSNAATAAYDDIAAAGADFGWEMGVVSRFSGFTIVDGKKVPTPRTTGIFTPITSITVSDNTVDNQRRRLPGRGA